MQEILLDRLVYIIDNPVLTLVIAFVSGFLATRIVGTERRPGTISFMIIGLMGFLLGYFMLSYYELNEYLDSLLELRIIIDMGAAFIGSFVIAGIFHFLKPS